MAFDSELSVTRTEGSVVPPDRAVARANVSAERFEITGRQPFEYGLESERHYFAVHDIESLDGELSVAGLPPTHDRDLKRRVTFIPAGLAVKGWTQPVERSNAFTTLYVADACIPYELRASSNRWNEPLVNAHDRELAATLIRLDTALRRDEPFAGLMSETIAVMALTELSQRWATSRDSDDHGERLSPERVARVREYIRANLGAPIGLSDLAAVVGLSKFHFARAFKASTGRSAYREVMEIRVGEAQRLLAGGGVGIAEAARLTGFNGAPQFSRAMRNMLGRSPRELRASPADSRRGAAAS